VGIIRLPPVAQELCHVFDILVASTKLVLAPSIVDSNKKRLSAGHGW
jgi:hypothetical protein